MIALDFETFFSKKLKYSLKSMIAESYCKHRLFDPYLLSVSDGQRTTVGETKDCTRFSEINGQRACAHNAAFDSTVWKEAQRIEVIPKDSNPVDWTCTANLTSYLCNRRALAPAVEQLFKVTLDKTARSDAADKHWPKDFPEAEQQRMLEYAGGDTIWCHKLWQDFGYLWPADEQRISRLTIDAGHYGVQINTRLLDDYLLQSHEVLQATQATIPWIQDAGDEDWEDFDVSPTSIKCIANQCRLSGIPCPPVKKWAGEEAYEEWEETYSKNNPWISSLSSWRSVNKLHKFFKVIRERLRPDGTMPYGLKYFGAHTGRWSGDAGVNLQNLRKLALLVNERTLMETNQKRLDGAYKYKDETGIWPGWVRYAIDTRALIIPRPGKKMIIADLAQIEARITRWFANDTAMLDLIRSGVSIYEAHARLYGGWTGGDLKKENKGLYALFKARELALGFGCGWKKFITMAATYDIDITAEDPEFVEEVDKMTGEVRQISGYGKKSKEQVADFRLKSAGITNIWKQLDDGLRASVGQDFSFKLPSGRTMRYEMVKSETRLVKDAETGKMRRKTELTVGVGGKRVPSYGGKLTENMVQATARDVFAAHLLRLTDAGVHVLFSSHDEAVIECEPNVKTADVERVMSYTPEWLDGCPIGAEASEVEHYCK